MGYFLKYWLKSNKLIGAENGYLSSYALQIMIIAFLQGGLEVPVLPNLLSFNDLEHSNMIEYLPRGSTDSTFKTNWYFITDIEDEINKLEEKFGRNEMSTAELIYKFWDFYLNKFNENKVISLRHGGYWDKIKQDSIAFSIIPLYLIKKIFSKFWYKNIFKM